MLKKAIFAVLLLWHATVAWAEEYRVSVNDQLDVRVVIWDAANGATLEMPGASGIYKVDASGTIAVALAGSVNVSGLTISEVASTIEAAMISFAPVGQTPKVGVAVDTYAPVYITGQIESPGAYDYSAGLTTFKLVALAGGLSGVTLIDGEERNFLSARGTAEVLQQELAYQIARRDRINAEIEGAADLAELKSAADDQAPLMIEEAILQSRNELYSHQLTSLEDTQSSLREALEVLEEKQATSQLQLEAGEAELKREEDLIERGLVAQARAFDGATYVSELQTRILDIDRSILEAKQELQNNERDAGLLLASRQEENVTMLQQVNSSIAQIEAQIAAQYGLMALAVGQQSGPMTELDPDAAAVVYEITRTVDGVTETFTADRNAAVKSGDVVEVLFEPEIDPSN